MSIPYTKQDTLFSFDLCKTLTTELLKYAQVDRTPAARKSWLARLKAGCNRDKLPPTHVAKILSTWQGILEAIGDGDAPLVLPDSFSGVHPLVMACLIEGSTVPLDDNRSVFWNRGGNYRSRAYNGPGARSPSVSASRGRRATTVASEPEEDEEGQAVLGFNLPKNVAGGVGLEDSEEEDDVVVVEDAPGDEADWEDERQVRNVRHHAAALNGSRPAARPRAQDFHSPPPPDRGQADHDIAKSSFFATVKGALARGGNYDEDLDVPDFVLHCRRVEQNFRRHTAKGKGSEAIGDIVSQIQVRIDPKDIQKILYGEHLPLCDVHSYEPRSIFEAPEGFEALVDSRFEAQRAKIRPLITLSALDLVEAWDLVSSVDAQFFPSRTQDRLIFRGRLRNYLRGSTTEVIHRIGAWVDRTGREIATIGGSVSHWGQANNADALYHELVTAPAAAALYAGGSRRAPGGPRQKCNKYNRGSHGDSDELGCDFDHLCANCGGKHSALDCTRRGGGEKRKDDGEGPSGRGGVGAASRDAARGGRNRRQ